MDDRNPEAIRLEIKARLAEVDALRRELQLVNVRNRVRLAKISTYLTDATNNTAAKAVKA